MEKEVYWSRYAVDFEQRNNYVAGARNIEAIRDVLAQQELKGVVLELGCGNGTYSRLLVRCADRVFATDFSDAMVCVSKERLKDLRNVTVEKESCFCLSYSDADFDSLVMVNLLHVIPEPEKALRESRRVLKRGGEIIVISFTMEGMGLLAKIGMIYRYLRAYGKPPDTSRKLTVGETTKMLETAGFRVREARLIGETSKAVFVRAVAI